MAFLAPVKSTGKSESSVQFFFILRVYVASDTYLLVGDETVVKKAGKATFGLDRFFSSLAGKPVPGVAFFTFALVNVQKRQAYTLVAHQVVRTAEEKQLSAQRKKLAAQRKQKGKSEGAVKTGAKILKSPDEFSPDQRAKLDRFSLTQSLLTTL